MRPHQQRNPQDRHRTRSRCEAAVQAAGQLRVSERVRAAALPTPHSARTRGFVCIAPSDGGTCCCSCSCCCFDASLLAFGCTTWISIILRVCVRPIYCFDQLCQQVPMIPVPRSGQSGTQGRRPSMEDDHVGIDSLRQV
jgi:hypothetical protein